MAKFYTVAFRQQAEAQFGVRQSTEVAKRAATAARRQLQKLPLQSQHAFPHIAEHFSAQPGKPAHGIFLPKYQQPQELTKLILRAIDNPGTEPMLSKSDDGDWAVVLQTWFGTYNPIGTLAAGLLPAVQNVGRTGGALPAQQLAHLCVVADLNGDLITAYPTNAYRTAGNRV